MKKLKNKKYKRVLLISDDHAQITMPDSRYYKRNGLYYPSITHVLSVYPKGKYFEDWLKKHGYSSEYIAGKAADEGTQVHELAERYLLGEELNFLDIRDMPIYTPHVWQMFLRFVDFWETHKPTLIEAEVHLFSDELKVAGTCDLVCEINGELWIIDFKTSNQLQTTYELQTAIYAKCYEECFGRKIDRLGILWLKSSSRGPDKNGKKIQGKNWILQEPSRKQERNIEIFKKVKDIFDLENPKAKPYTQTFPTVVKRKE